MELERTAKELGADLFGVADLGEAQDFACEQGGESLRGFPRAVSIGMRLLDAVVDELHRHEDRATIFSYRALYSSVNSRLDDIALQVAREIQEEGHRAYPVPASQTIDTEKMIGVIPHKLAAHLSGLGWIGKSCLLITPSHGPRVRLATVLTDAPLEPGSQIDGGCGECRDCVSICPVKAITGVPFRPSDPRHIRFNARLCRDYSEKRKERLGEGLCGLCVYVCPYGQSGGRHLRVGHSGPLPK